MDSTAVRWRVMGWLERLAGVGTALLEMANAGAGAATEAPGSATEAPGSATTAPGAAERNLARALVARAMRWTYALNDRLVLEGFAAVAALRTNLRAFVSGRRERPAGPRSRRSPRPRPTPVFHRYDWVDGVLWVDGVPLPSREERRRPARRRPHRCIKGRSVIEIVAQICRDLDGAARLLESAAAGRCIGEIAEAARALLGDPAEGWQPEQLPKPLPEPAAKPLAQSAAGSVAQMGAAGYGRPAVVPSPRPPDSG